VKFSNRIDIERSADDVFTYLAALENLPRWNYAISETIRVSDGAVGLGAVYNQTRTLPRPMSERLEITEFVPAQRLTVTGGFGLLEGHSTYVLDPDPSGARTTLVNDIELSGDGVLGPLAALKTGGIKRAVAQNLGVLKQILEAR
jgi:uncharacterized protein YndB with AHSA1/START domain